jgi:hypothetical protein
MKKRSMKKGIAPKNKSYAASGMKMKVKMPGTKPAGMPDQNPVRNSMMEPLRGITAPAVGTPQNVMYQKLSKMRRRSS